MGAGTVEMPMAVRIIGVICCFLVMAGLVAWPIIWAWFKNSVEDLRKVIITGNKNKRPKGGLMSPKGM